MSEDRGSDSFQKIHHRIWLDCKFRSLSIDAQYLFFAMLTHHDAWPIGVIHQTRNAFIEQCLINTGHSLEDRPLDELNDKRSQMINAFVELVGNGFILEVENSPVFFIKNYMRYNRPDNINVVKYWVKHIKKLPENHIVWFVVAKAREVIVTTRKSNIEVFERLISEAFPDSFLSDLAKGFGNGSGNGSGNGMPNNKEVITKNEFKNKLVHRNQKNQRQTPLTLVGRNSTNDLCLQDTIEKQPNRCDENEPVKNTATEKNDPDGLIEPENQNTVGQGRPDKNPNHEPNDETEVTPNSKKRHSPNCPYQKIIDAYNEHLVGLPEVFNLTEARKRTLKARWREKKERQNIGWWVGYFNHIERSDFLMGRTDTGFAASFDWIIKLSNMIKICEGNYHQKLIGK